MKIKEVVHIIDDWCPFALAEDFDNVGLLVGNPEQEVTGVLVTHDVLEDVVDEAIAEQCNTIVCFHPIIFSGLKSITGKNYVERVVLKAIQNQIAIIALHTALDNHPKGVNYGLCKALGLDHLQTLLPKKKFLYKLNTYVPVEHHQKVRAALFEAGAGEISNYSSCSFNWEGKGTFMANEEANPYVGKENELHTEDEICIQLIFEKHQQSNVLQALQEAHPYEEVAYEIVALDNAHRKWGMGMIGNYEKPLSEEEFLATVKQTLSCGGIRHSELVGKPIQKVAVLGGSGSFAISAAVSQGCDAFITADLKYHQFYEAENRLLLLDVGHYESEQYTKNIIFDFLTKKIPNFAVRISQINTNPIKYF